MKCISCKMHTAAACFEKRQKCYHFTAHVYIHILSGFKELKIELNGAIKSIMDNAFSKQPVFYFYADILW